jgi:hypothetical protein
MPSRSPDDPSGAARLWNHPGCPRQRPPNAGAGLVAADSCASEFEPEPWRFALQTRPRRLWSQRGYELVAFVSEREDAGSPSAAFAQLLALLVATLERELVAADLCFELRSAIPLPPVEAPEFALGCCESFDRLVA